MKSNVRFSTINPKRVRGAAVNTGWTPANQNPACRGWHEIFSQSVKTCGGQVVSEQNDRLLNE